MAVDKVGRNPGALSSNLNKHQSRMVCAICGRALTKAAALSRGMSVGPGCAVSAGLVQRKPATARVAEHGDSFTLDLFPQ